MEDNKDILGEQYWNGRKAGFGSHFNDEGDGFTS